MRLSRRVFTWVVLTHAYVADGLDKLLFDPIIRLRIGVRHLRLLVRFLRTGNPGCLGQIEMHWGAFRFVLTPAMNAIRRRARTPAVKAIAAAKHVQRKTGRPQLSAPVAEVIFGDAFQMTPTFATHAASR